MKTFTYVVALLLLSTCGEAALQKSCDNFALDGVTFGDVNDSDTCKAACQYFFGRDAGCTFSLWGGRDCQYSFLSNTDRGMSETSCRCGTLGEVCYSVIKPLPTRRLQVPSCAATNVTTPSACQTQCSTYGTDGTPYNFRSTTSGTGLVNMTCMCGAQGNVCQDVNYSPPIVPLIEKDCATENVTTGNNCRAACTSAGARAFSFAVNTVNGVPTAVCRCGTLGTFCSGPVSSVFDGVVVVVGNNTSIPSCAAKNISTPSACRTECNTYGMNGRSFTFRSARSVAGLVNTTCTCDVEGTICEDVNYSPPVIPLIEKDCTVENITTGDSCRSACNSAGALAYSFATNTFNGVRTAVCTCGTLGTFCKGPPVIPLIEKDCATENIASVDSCRAACAGAGALAFLFATNTLNSTVVCSCGALGIFCKGPPIIPLIEKACATENVTSVESCRAKCTTAGSLAFSFAANTINGVRTAICTCGPLGIFCKGPVSGVIDGGEGGVVVVGNNTGIPSCAAKNITTPSACQTECNNNGTSGGSFTFRSATSVAGLVNTTCTCNILGTICQDVNYAPPIIPLKETDCATENVTTVDSCRAACSSAGARTFSFTTDTIDGIRNAVCTCGVLGTFCKGPVSGAIEGGGGGGGGGNNVGMGNGVGFPQQPKGCGTSNTTSGPACRTQCDAFGVSGMPFSFRSATSITGLVNTTCSCGNLGNYCQDVNYSPPDMMPRKSCAAEGITTRDQCNAACSTAGSASASFSTSISNGVRTTVCSCGPLGAFCRDPMTGGGGGGGGVIIGFCFPGDAIVKVEGKGHVMMQDLMLGDRVLVGGTSSNEKYEKVHSFGHRNEAISYDYLQLKLATINSAGDENAFLEITKDHMVFTSTGRSVPSGIIRVGDSLQLANGDTGLVTDIQEVHKRGAYAPFTGSGTIVVNGVKSSSYIAFQPFETLHLFWGRWDTGLSFQFLAHTFEAPHRLWCASIGDCLTERYTAEGISRWVDVPHKMVRWLLFPVAHTALSDQES